DEGGQAFDLQCGVPAHLVVTQTGPASGDIASNQCNGLTFQITVSNYGPGVARNVRVTDFLPVDPPTGVTVATVGQIIAAGSTCPQTTTAIVVCDLGDVPTRAALPI